MMVERLEDYRMFFEDQIRENENEYRNYLATKVGQLFRQDMAYFGHVVGVDAKRGHLILRFAKGRVPRLKVEKTFCIVRQQAWEDLGSHPTEWTCSCAEYFQTKMYHTSFSDILPLYFLKQEGTEYDYVGCGSVDYALYNAIAEAVKMKRTVCFTLFDSFPPVDYFLNLIAYQEMYPEDKNLYLDGTKSYTDWHPRELACGDEIDGSIEKVLADSRCCVVQGPPGTGKSYTIASIVKGYLGRGGSVCVTTMTNKGLMEVVAKPPLAEEVRNGCVSKTMLSAEEIRELPGLTLAPKDLVAGEGRMLCATFYALSGLYRDTKLRVEEGIYDLIVIEEASQAFLTTLAAFCRLGKHCLIVGDPMQLPPIVLNAGKKEYACRHIESQVKGLQTFVLGTELPSFRLISSFRLTPKASKQTGVFYENSLSSVQQNPLDFSAISSPWFPEEGGGVVCTLKGARDEICSEGAIREIRFVVNAMQQYYPSRSLAILSPFRDTVRKLQSEFYYNDLTLDLTVETIDRIQGLTVDYCIFYLPMRNLSFAVSPNRFNVATSRSRSTTLILTDVPLERLHSIDQGVWDYLSDCRHYTE